MLLCAVIAYKLFVFQKITVLGRTECSNSVKACYTFPPLMSFLVFIDHQSSNQYQEKNMESMKKTIFVIFQQPPPKLPSGHFSDEFCEFVNKW